MSTHVPANATYARIAVWPETPSDEDIQSPERWGAFVFDVDIGHLDPVEEPGGISMRLENMGLCSNVLQNPELEESDAIREFQRRHGLRETGLLDEETRARIEREHDGSE
jgi:hypothetical protein